MSTRAHLADEQPALPFRGPRPRLSAEDYIRRHPGVYECLVRLARARLAAGERRIGIKKLWEDARWDEKLRTGDTPYRLDNNQAHPIARIIAAREPDLRDCFEFRERRA